VACFDKTGTLTAENLVFEGVSGIGSDTHALLNKDQITGNCMLVLASAHALVRMDDTTIGDPMEKNTVETLGWQMDVDDTVKCATHSVHIHRRFAFSSALKRMSAVCTIKEGERKGLSYVAVKGAPEIMKGMYKSVPGDYDEVYKSWARKGSRVLALGFRELKGSLDKAKVRSLLVLLMSRYRQCIVTRLSAH
jgi:manganese-transporting P-type ATPase